MTSVYDAIREGAEVADRFVTHSERLKITSTKILDKLSLHRELVIEVINSIPDEYRDRVKKSVSALVDAYNENMEAEVETWKDVSRMLDFQVEYVKHITGVK